jgi:PAS domain S-box-containing protein
MVNLLNREGHDVVTAQDGLAALDLLRSFRPDILFTDWLMPHIDAGRLCRVIRRTPELQNTYVVLLTGVAAEELTTLAYLGADAYIAKSSFPEMTRHVMQALQGMGEKSRDPRSFQPQGLQALDPRELTRELLAVKRHFEVVLESMAEGILEMTQDARIFYANPAAIACVGVPEERLLGMEFFSLFSESDRSHLEILAAEVGHGPCGVSRDAPVRIEDRQLAIKMLAVGDGTRSCIAILDDVTEERHMTAQLRQDLRMEAMGVLAGGIAHDFNNILTVIIGNISLAKIFAQAGGNHFAKLEEAERAAHRAMDLAQQLLPFAPGGVPIRKVTHLEDLIAEVSQQALAGTGATVEWDVPDDLRPVAVDPRQMRQAMLHILQNAAEAMPKGGTVSIAGRNLSRKTARRMGLGGERYLEFTIQDHGTGIPREHLARIFDPYFTTKKGGSGLGLAAVYSIMKRHDGLVTVESAEGRGTTVHLLLPVARDPVAAQPLKAEDHFQGAARILVMDDEPMVRTVVGEILTHLGYGVTLAEDGLEALQRYREAMEAGQGYAAVILDLTVPGGMGGAETLRALQRIDPRVKAVVSSGYSTAPIMARHKDFGFTAVLVKPYKIDEIRAVLQSVMAEGVS